MQKSNILRQLFSCGVFFLTTQFSQAQHSINFDGGWTVILPDGAVRSVSLPRAWNEDDAFRVNNSQLPTGLASYVKEFDLPKEAKGKRVFIEFEGARQSARVYLNDHYLGLHENGITAFGFDLSPYLSADGHNRLEVVTDNSWNYAEEETDTQFQWNNKNFNANYGGLPKHVRLHILGEVYQTLPLYSSFGTTGVYIYAEDYDIAGGTATVVAESQVRNDGRKVCKVSYQVRVDDAQGTHVSTFGGGEQQLAPSQLATFTARQRLPLRFWQWREPHLYSVTTTIMVDGSPVDSVRTVTGFRKTQFGPDGLFRLNDRVFMVHGYAQRTSNEWPGVGMSVPAWLSDYSNGLLVESGGNLVRWMHTMPWRQDVESCDRVGLLQAMPAGDAEKDVEGRQWAQRVEVMRDAIVYNRNNPSIVFYESGNKGISEAHMQEMKAVRDAFDPHGGRAIGSREMLSRNTCAEYGGEMLYINKSGNKPVWAMEYCRDEGLRRYWDDWSFPYHKNGDGPLYRNEPATAYNLNQDQLAIEHVRRWYDYWLVRPGTGRRVSSGGVKIIFSDTNTHCRGESNYRASGVVDAMRLPKDSFFAHRVMWNGWVDPETPDIYVMGHWNYDAGVVKPVYVVSNCDSVGVLLNGRPLPVPQRDYQYLFTIDSVRYEPGTLTAIGYNAGTEACRYELCTIGEPAALKLTVMTAGTSPHFVSDQAAISADAADMALLQFEVVDENGRRCPLDNRTVHFTVDGPAEWRGGIAKGEGNCILSHNLPVECGVNRALIRSTTQPGVIRIKAEAEGLSVAELVVVSNQPSPLSLSAREGSNHFEGTKNVSPAHSSQVDDAYNGSKRTIEVVKVTDSFLSSEEQLSPACDDDEETEWKNDGKRSTAWLTFHFGQAEMVVEISMKLTGWRRRSYPLEVLADDGNILWTGSTPLSLGYVTLPLTMQRPTSSITIRLRGTATDGDAFGQVQELTQPVANELDLYKAKDGDKVHHELRIIECDFLRK